MGRESLEAHGDAARSGVRGFWRDVGVNIVSGVSIVLVTAALATLTGVIGTPAGRSGLIVAIIAGVSVILHAGVILAVVYAVRDFRDGRARRKQAVLNVFLAVLMLFCVAIFLPFTISVFGEVERFVSGWDDWVLEDYPFPISSGPNLR